MPPSRALFAALAVLAACTKTAPPPPPAVASNPPALTTPAPAPTSLATAVASIPSAPPAPVPSAPAFPVREPTQWFSAEKTPFGRVAEAKKSKMAEVKRLFAEARVAFPPAQMFLRAFKKERVLELWAASRADEPLSLIAIYGVCYASGELGPKRVEGDGQVPEGLYKIKESLPGTPFYLALHVDYPNRSDRILGDRRQPGGEILIHGSCASVGCLAMSDDRMAEIYLAASEYKWTGASLPVHIFPTRDMAGLLASPAGGAHRAFWENLKPFLEEFEQTRRVPKYRIDAKGRYEQVG
ncbi:L,D-transpeptidase family protein [Polyangium sp. y55x31]|uniref:L,D-transpeptidase family protein n=1 Tax=Polyangium sp. y55x31 TaxID=3042688 RepID=UPI0024829520|nr:L,D-transpeptidase family protein [Polyangium sp. y55x31]MDI1477558.1 hypothetical protein [Polyangium sp. y55x31]